MDTEKHGKLICVSFFAHACIGSLCIFLGFLLSACGGKIVPPQPTSLRSPIPVETIFPTPSIALTSTPTCVDGLTFINDVTIPDLSIVAPGITLDKQWLVQNSGSCNWDSRYRLRMVDGNVLGASPEQALYPARAGMQVTLRVVFIAPPDPGEYISEWQAYNSQGIPFGQTFFIKIIVQ
jgi:hypothetical protein